MPPAFPYSGSGAVRRSHYPPCRALGLSTRGSDSLVPWFGRIPVFALLLKVATEIRMNRQHWQRLLETQEHERGYSDGFKLLFCPWRLIETADTLFLSLNPGSDPSGEFMRIASDERGNSYLVRRAVDHSPIAAQFQKLCQFLGKDPETVLTGSLMPYRTASWQPRRDRPNLQIAEPFWKAILASGRLRQVFCMGRDVEASVVAMTGARLQKEIPANWGTLTQRRHLTADGIKVYGMLHLSTYKIFSRPDCLPQLAELFEMTEPS